MGALFLLPMFAALAIVGAADFTPVTYSDISAVVSALEQQISVANIVTFLAACIGVVVTLAFMWWGVRKVVRMFTSAWKKGKIRV